MNGGTLRKARASRLHLERFGRNTATYGWMTCESYACKGPNENIELQIYALCRVVMGKRGPCGERIWPGRRSRKDD